MAIDLADAFFPTQISTGRIRTSLILHERDRSAFTVLPQGYAKFPVPGPNRVCRDLIVLTFHQSINDILLMGCDENGVASILDVLVSEPVCGDKFYRLKLQAFLV